MDDKSFNIRVPKRWVRVAMIVGVTALIVAPLTAIATHSFTDVPDSNTFHSDIEWMKDAGVTAGCNPPANTQYCPDDNVTRGQMAAFMNRFAGYIGAADGTPAQADNATTAGDADTLDGKDSSVFVEEGEADTVSSEMTTNEPGVAQTIQNSSVGVTSTAPVEIASVTIETPAAGFVVVTATSQPFVGHASGTQSGLDAFGVSNSATSLPADQDKDWNIPDGAATGTYLDTMSAHKIFPVSAGSHTFYLLAELLTGSPTVQIEDNQLSAIFYPTSYGSVETSSVSGSATDGPDGE